MIVMYSYWTFSDIFEEQGFSSVPFDDDAFGMQTIHGVPKPVYRGFQLLNSAGRFLLTTTQTPAVRSSSVSSMTTLTDTGAIVYMSNFDMVNSSLSSVLVTYNLTDPVGFARVPKVYWYYISDSTVSPRAQWISMGSPAYPNSGQIDAMIKASVVIRTELVVKMYNNTVVVDRTMEPWSCAKLEFVY